MPKRMIVNNHNRTKLLKFGLNIFFNYAINKIKAKPNHNQYLTITIIIIIM